MCMAGFDGLRTVLDGLKEMRLIVAWQPLQEVQQCALQDHNDNMCIGP